MAERLWTVRELADYLKLHPATITRKLVDGAIKGIRPMSFNGTKAHWRITQVEVDRLIGVQHGD